VRRETFWLRTDLRKKQDVECSKEAKAPERPSLTGEDLRSIGHLELYTNTSH